MQPADQFSLAISITKRRRTHILTLPTDKHIIVPIGGKMTAWEFANLLSKLDGALAIKVHPD